MLRFTLLFLFCIVLCTFDFFDFTTASSVQEYFCNQGEISFDDKNGTLLSIVGLSNRITKSSCAASCLENLACNAIEFCSSQSGQECRLSKGWKNTGSVSSGSKCNRMKIVDECEGEGYMDRRSRICTYDACETCDCVSSHTKKSGVYRVVIAGDPKHAYCSFEGNRVWTKPSVLRFYKKRKDGSENFQRNWTDYEFGFGSPESEVWLGNKYIHQLTAAGHTILRIELEDHSGNKRFAEYSSLTVADVTDNYRIRVSGYTGDAGDSFAGTCFYCNNGMPFTTYDNDNDSYGSGNCAVWSNGGWWHSMCHRTNLNGQYGNNNEAKGINWEDWLSLRYSLKGSTMKTRRP